MGNLKLPEWAKKWGVAGLIVLAAGVLLRLAIEPVFEQEIQGLWADRVKPFLLSSARISFELSRWILALIALALVGLVAFAVVLHRIYWGRSRTVSARMRSAVLPKNGTVPYVGGGDIIRAIKMTQAGEMDPDDLALIVQQSVNQKKLDCGVGSKVLKDFGYLLVVVPGGGFVAERRWREHED